jgi:putative tryptophan/tyrosine transport system substrate-binding protein
MFSSLTIKRVMSILLLLLLVVACTPAATPETVAPTASPVTEEPAPAASPTQEAAPTETAEPTQQAGTSAGPEEGRTYVVGFSQIVDHPALNATREGFLAALQDAGFVEGENLTFDYQNAQGEVTNARNIAEKFLADEVDLIAPCTTPNAQAAAQVARGSDIPVVFGCVTDPVSAGIVESLTESSGNNITGMYNPIPISELFDLFLEIYPDMETVGTIYNASEDNSVVINEQARAEAEARGLEWVEATVASSAEVRTAAQSLVGQIDAYIIGQDNTVASALEALVGAAQDNDLPVFAMDPQAVERGAVASLATNQYDAGYQWGAERAVPVLLGADPGELPLVRPSSFDLQINLEAAEAAGLTIPEDIIERADEVFGEQ